jgi:hypothetical protein
MVRESRLNRARRARLALRGIVTKLGIDLNAVIVNGSLSAQGRAEAARRILDTAQTDLAQRYDELREMARGEIAQRQQSLDEYLAVNDDAIAARAAVYQSILIRAHDHPDQVLKVLRDRYGDPVARRLLLDTLTVVLASYDRDKQRGLEEQIACIHDECRHQMPLREQELQTALDAANEFHLYVETAINVAETAASYLTLTGTSIQIDMHAADIMFTTTEPAFERYEAGGHLAKAKT